MANTPYARFAPVRYSDNTSLPRLSISGNELPLSRVISTKLFIDNNDVDETNTLLTMQWGQFIAHDILSSANNGFYDCCNVANDPNVCLAISVPQDDYFYRQFNVTCINMVRKLNTYHLNCGTTFAEQINTVSTYIDASVVYGSSLEVANNLRTFTGGLLKSQLINNKEFLPFADNEDDCKITAENSVCFKAGDNRVNQNPELTVLQTMMMRIHNKMVKELSELKPDWSDEALYQEIRAILAGVVQHVTYNEWLQSFISERAMKNFKILPSQEGSSKYDPSVDPRMFTSFVSGAFRAFHAIIQGRLGYVYICCTHAYY